MRSFGSSMISVLHLVDTTVPGGAETIFLEMVRHNNGPKYRPVPVILGPGWVHDSLTSRGFHPIVAPMTQGPFNVRFLGRLIQIIRHHRVRLLHCHMLASNVYGSLAGLLTRRPVICTFHGQADAYPDERFSSAKAWIMNHGAKRIVFVSQALRHDFLARYPINVDITTVIPNGIDVTLFRGGRDDSIRRSLGLSSSDVLVGAVGNVHPAKAYDVFLHTAARLIERSRRYHFILVGENTGPLGDQIRNLRDSLGITEHVTLLGFRSDIARIMRNLDVYVLTSRSEGFSLTTVQAMASRTPVVATRCGGPTEIVTDGVDGLLAENGAPDDIAKQIERIVTNPSLRTALTTAALETVDRRFTINRMLSGYRELYAACT